MQALRFPAIEQPRASVLVLAWKHQEHLLACLQSLHTATGGRVPFEVVLLFNGAAAALQHRVREIVHGVTMISADANLGFAGGCNRAAEAARGDYLVLLNDDATVEPGWLEWLVATADADPSAGAVGSAILFPDGRLQEVGSIVWSDGSTMPVARELPGETLEWQFVRQVDYVSACSLLVRRATWDAIGGMDERYHPAYYEDVDLCLAIRSRRQRVLLEPRSRVRHHESMSSEERYKLFLSKRNRRIFAEKWKAELPLYEPPPDFGAPAITRAVWRARGAPRRVLVVDDLVSDRAAGAGFGRMADALVALAGAGFAVTLAPTAGVTSSVDALISNGVQVITGALDAHLSRPEVLYDAIVVSRPHNFDHAAPLARRHQPWAPIVYDCEALFWRRLERQAKLAANRSEAAELAAQAAAMRELEGRIAVESDFAVAVSAAEADWLASIEGHCPIEVVPPVAAQSAFTTAPFSHRRDAAFVAGWLAGPTSPNADGFRWFVSEVLPHVRERLPWARIRVTGAHPPDEILALGDPNVRFEGRVPDLESFYGAIRAAICPLRFGAGVKVKVVEALQYGIPVVSTTVGAEGIETHGREAIDVADDAAEFARLLVLLLTDEPHWDRRRLAIAELVEAWRPPDGVGSWPTLLTRLLARRRHA